MILKNIKKKKIELDNNKIIKYLKFSLLFKVFHKNKNDRIIKQNKFELGWVKLFKKINEIDK